MVRLPSWTPIPALLLAGAACGGSGIDVNQVDNQVNEGGTTTGANPPPTTYQDPFAGAPPYAAPGGGGDGSHHAGESCMQQGCHGSAGGGGHSEAPTFLVGGTVYQDYYGMVPAAGVEVRIIDSAGHAASTYSGREGNFYIRDTASNGVTFPAVVGARNGTIARPMITTLSATMGSCAQSPCHVAGSSPAKGTYYPIHVP